MNITEPKIAEYIDRITPPPDEILQEMAALGEERDFPCIGPQCGRLLYSLVKISGAKRIFEVGSGFGYSLYWMASAAPADAQIIGSDLDQKNVAAAADFFKRGKLEHKVELRFGDGLELFKALPGEFDIIVCDADKTQYPEIFTLAAPRLKIGGLFITDNVLWDGKVVQDTDDASTKAIQEYNKLIFADERFHSLIIPLRDGLAVSLRQA